MGVDKAEKIKQRIAQHGFGVTTPKLTKTLSADIFQQHYYDKKTLVLFCKRIGISTTGLKHDLNARIGLFLSTGVITRITPQKNKAKPDSEQGLKLDTRVVYYKSDPETRLFFQQHIPAFRGFSAFVQKWLKERLNRGERFTYAEVIQKHEEHLYNQHQAKVNTKPSIVTHDSCQYNQFCIDYRNVFILQKQNS